VTSTCTDKYRTSNATADRCRPGPRHRSLLWRITILGTAILIAAVIVLPSGWALTHNPLGVFTGAAAGAVCFLAAGVSLSLSGFFRKPGQVLALVLVGMMARMGIPLMAALIASLLGGPLADAGFLNYLIVFYLVMLAVETALVLSAIPADACDLRAQRKEAC
jgi:hypothetical protein